MWPPYGTRHYTRHHEGSWCDSPRSTVQLSSIHLGEWSLFEKWCPRSRKSLSRHRWTFALLPSWLINDYGSLLELDNPLGQDALAHSWPHHVLYTSLTLPRILLTLHRIQQIIHTVILVSLRWLAMHWFWLLPSLMIRTPWQNPSGADLLSRSGHLCLWVWPLRIKHGWKVEAVQQITSSELPDTQNTNLSSGTAEEWQVPI